MSRSKRKNRRSKYMPENPSTPGSPGGVQTLAPAKALTTPSYQQPTYAPKCASDWDDDKPFGNTETLAKFKDHDYTQYHFPDMNEACAAPCQKLTFSILAIAKLCYFLHAGETEVGGFGVSTPANPLYIQDIHFLPQECSAALTEFDNGGLAAYLNYREEQTGLAGLPPIWIHTHPGSSPHPSGTDEVTFKDKFGVMPWSVMFIMSRTHATYCRIQNKLSIGEKGSNISSELGVDIDPYKMAKFIPELATYSPGWNEEYLSSVEKKTYSYTTHYNYSGAKSVGGTKTVSTVNFPQQGEASPGRTYPTDAYGYNEDETDYSEQWARASGVGRVTRPSLPVSSQNETGASSDFTNPTPFGADPAPFGGSVPGGNDGKIFDPETKIWLPLNAFA